MDFEINDTVLVFGEYEGILLEINSDRVIIYCPAFCEKEPYIVTDISNITNLDSQERTKFIN